MDVSTGLKRAADDPAELLEGVGTAVSYIL